MRRLADHRWGCSKVVLLRFYEGWIRPLFEYAAPVLLLFNETVLVHLERMQDKCLRLCIGISPKRKVNRMTVMSAAPCFPLLIRRLELTNRLTDKLLRQGSSTALGKLWAEGNFATESRCRAWSSLVRPPRSDP